MKNVVLKCSFILTMNLLLPFLTEAQQFWNTTNEFWGGPKTGITITHDSVIIVSTNRAVMKSTNECEQLEKVLSASEIYSVFSTKEGKIFAGGLGKIFFSSDLGINWDSVSIHSNYPVIEFAENSTADIFAITSDYDEGDGVYYSGDHGVNWEKRNSGLGTHLGCSNIAVDKNDLLYLTISDEQNVGFGGLFVSDDDGLTWEKISVSVNLLSNPIRIGTTTGLSVLPNDSIYLSFYGLASNYLIQLNIYKSINDVRINNSWEVLQLMGFQNWWEDFVLNDIKITQNGDWYSSTSGTVSNGGTCYSTDGENWEILDFGLGTDILGTRSEQFFTEKENGRVFMIQMLDERIYKTNKSLYTGIRDPVQISKPISVYPNPVTNGQKITVQLQSNSHNNFVTLYDITGKTIYSSPVTSTENKIDAPGQKGVYIVEVVSDSQKYSSKLFVQ